MEKTSSSQDQAVAIQGMNPAQGEKGAQRVTISGETIGQLVQMQNQYRSLKGLREREQASTQILVGALKDALFEINVNISLSRESLAPAFPGIREGWLCPDSTVTVIDSTGTKTSVPLEKLPSNTIALALQECAAKLNQQMSQKVDSIARSVDLLEKAVSELDLEERIPEQDPVPGNAQEQTEKVEPQKAEEKENTSTGDKKMIKKPAKAEGLRFAYNAEFGRGQEEAVHSPAGQPPAKREKVEGPLSGRAII